MNPEDIGDFSEEESVEYEYVDEDGNPIPAEKLDEYETIDEDEYDEPDDNEDPLDEEPEEESTQTIEQHRPELSYNLHQNTAEENDEILRDIGDLTGIPIEELRSKKKFDQDTQKLEETREETEDPIISQLTKIANSEKEEIIEQTPEESDKNYLINQAKASQEKIQKPLELLDKKQAEENDELLQKLSMSKPPHYSAEPEREKINVEQFHKKDHPHIGSSYSMDTIESITKRIFNTDEALERLNKAKKK